MSRWFWLWCLTSAVFLLLATQVVVTFNDLTCWKLTLLAVEYGHRFAVAALLLAWVHWRQGGFARRCLAWCNVVAAVVLFVPLAEAWRQARHLPEELRTVFGKTPETAPAPYHPVSLWFGTWRRNMEPERMEYFHDGEGSQSLELFRAQKKSPAPCVVVIHAGSWEKESENEFPDYSTWWAIRGYAVAAIQYRLAPQHAWPAQLEDVKQALNFLKANAERLGVDPTKFILLGRSAGGQIAAACVSGLRDPAVCGCVALYGPMDLAFAHRFARDTDVLDSFRLLHGYLGGDPVKAAATYLSGSAYLTARAQSCPMLLLHGSRDILVWNLQSRRMAARLRTLGVRHYLLEPPLAVHGFDWAYDGANGQLARYAMDVFMDAVTQGKP